jgi:exopolysaccharide production protein ExoQ
MKKLATNIGKRVRISNALWIPFVWLFIAGSRPVSLWLRVQMIGTSADDMMEGSPLDRNILTLLMVLGLVVLAARGRKVGSLLRSNAPILLFFAYCGMSVFWSDFSDVALKRWIRALGDLVMVLVVLTDPAPSAAFKRLLSRLAFLTIPLSILCDLGRGLYGQAGRFYLGVTTNKNMFGMISMLCGVGAMWHFLTTWWGDDFRNRSRRLWAYGIAAALSLWLIRMADSATSTACFALGTGIIVITNRWAFARKPLVMHLLVASVVFLALYGLILNPGAGIISTMGRDATLTGRTDVWQAVIPMNPRPWLGAGFESFWLGPRLKRLWRMFVWQPNEAHNGYIEMYLNLGWVGLSLLAVVLLSGYWRIVQSFRSDIETASLRLTYFVIIVVYNLTEAGFRLFSPIWIIFLLSIMAVFKLRPQNAVAMPPPARSWDLSSRTVAEHSPAMIGGSLL